MFSKPLMKRIRIAVLAAIVSSLCFAATSAFAALAIDFTGATVDWNDGNNYSLGWSFTANTDLYVDALGVYAAPDFTTGERVFTENHEVGIYNSTGQLLASTTVSNADALNGLFRFHALENRITLTAGSTYYIAATMGADQYTWDPTGFSVNPNITFGQNYYTLSDTLAIPMDSDAGTVGYFGPNMDMAPVPVPAAAWLLGSGLGLFGMVRRRIAR